MSSFFLFSARLLLRNMPICFCTTAPHISIRMNLYIKSFFITQENNRYLVVMLLSFNLRSETFARFYQRHLNLRGHTYFCLSNSKRPEKYLRNEYLCTDYYFLKMVSPSEILPPLKFIYSEKATKFCKIFPLLLTVCNLVKSKVKISQNFLVFSEYMNFNFKNLFYLLICIPDD